MTDTANLLGYTVYPVDVPGMDSRSSAIDIQVGPLPVDGPRIGGVDVSTGAVAYATQTALPSPPDRLSHLGLGAREP